MNSETESLTPVAVLLSRAQAGDARAMNDLLAEITPYVTRMCVPIARDNRSDAVQEALLAIYRGLGTLREPAAFYGWVRSVTTREAVRTVKRLRTEVACSPVEPGQQTGSVDAVHINDVLDRLSEAHRQILALRFYGLNEDEIATTLSLPVGTVRSRLFRARRRFQEAWQPRAA
ncbi:MULTISPECIES: RNA polymerase sigma factor [unclassified Streptomyces]|uniref:RNA polymerase sigma factor n=1 Tax=unclassified Streptomyces TaxID=2593676 RepID=UPI002E289518|nr:RNA polymerase sigma factor [Streptomyces sp. NBC_00223]